MAETTTGRLIVTGALIELEIIGAGEVPDPNDAALVLSLLNRMVGQWNTRRRYIWERTIFSQAWVTSKAAYTIGPSAADFAVTHRPPKIEWANLVRVAPDPDTRTPLEVIEVLDWAEITVPNETAEEPSRIYYSPGVLNGTIRPWPYPSNTAAALANKLELFLWTLLSRFATLDTSVDLPDGYEDALVLSLAEKSARSFGRAVTADLMMDARAARANIQSVNNTPPKLSTIDSGMPGSRG
jgi:hypothetical protein